MLLDVICIDRESNKIVVLKFISSCYRQCRAGITLSVNAMHTHQCSKSYIIMQNPLFVSLCACVAERAFEQTYVIK